MYFLSLFSIFQIKLVFSTFQLSNISIYELFKATFTWHEWIINPVSSEKEQKNGRMKNDNKALIIAAETELYVRTSCR